MTESKLEGLIVDLLLWLEHEEFGSALSDAAVRTIGRYMRLAYDAGGTKEESNDI